MKFKLRDDEVISLYEHWVGNVCYYSTVEYAEASAGVDDDGFYANVVYIRVSAEPQ